MMMLGLFCSFSSSIEFSTYYARTILILLEIGAEQWWGHPRFFEKALRRQFLWILWIFARRMLHFLCHVIFSFTCFIYIVVIVSLSSIVSSCHWWACGVFEFLIWKGWFLDYCLDRACIGYIVQLPLDSVNICFWFLYQLMNLSAHFTSLCSFWIGDRYMFDKYWNPHVMLTLDCYIILLMDEMQSFFSLPLNRSV